jgi:O-antigen/teichoic acid export membrane protein
LFLQAYFIFFILHAAASFIAYGYSREMLRKIALPRIAELRKIFAYALLSCLGNIVFFLVYRVDYWFVNRYASPEELGNYIQVSKLANIFLLIPSIISSAIFTKTASDEADEHSDLFKTISRALSFSYALIILIIILTGKWLFPFIYGASFELMYDTFLLLAPGILSLSTLALLIAYYSGRGMLSLNVKGAVLSLVVIVTGNFIFTPFYGIYAAAAVSSAGYTCFLAYILFRFKKDHERSPISHFFIPQSEDIRHLKQIFRPNENK